MQAATVNVTVHNRGSAAALVRWRYAGAGVAMEPPAAELAPGGSLAAVVHVKPLAAGQLDLQLHLDAAVGGGLVIPLSAHVSSAPLGCHSAIIYNEITYCYYKKPGHPACRCTQIFQLLSSRI